MTTRPIYDLKGMGVNRLSVKRMRKILTGEAHRKDIMLTFRWQMTPQGSTFWGNVHANRVPLNEWAPLIEAMLAQAAIRGIE